MHGAKLSRESIMAGIGHWRLHLLVFASTFIVFPIVGLGLAVIVPKWMSPTVYMGFYICVLYLRPYSQQLLSLRWPGNIAAAICSASASSILGVFLSPILVGLLMDADGSQAMDTLNAIGSILMQLMLPFVVGHLSRPLIANWINRNRKLVNMTDRSSILLVVYVAFSEAVVEGIWQKIDAFSLFMIVVVTCVILFIIIVFNTLVARLLGFSKEDEITIVFCGSKKSLANGVPMANVLFPAATVGVILLPLMIFHQIQLMVSAVLAQRYAKRLSTK